MEGLSQGDWVLVDAGDVVVHIFRAEVRSYYDLEGMWSVDEDGTEAEPNSGARFTARLADNCARDARCNRARARRTRSTAV